MAEQRLSEFPCLILAQLGGSKQAHHKLMAEHCKANGVDYIPPAPKPKVRKDNNKPYWKRKRRK